MTGADDDTGVSRGIWVFSGNLTISGTGTLEATGGTASSSSYGIEANSVTISDNATVTATGGAADPSTGGSYGIHAGSVIISDSVVVNVYGGKAGTSNGLHTNGGTITISGGTVTAFGGEAHLSSYGLHGNNSSITICGNANVNAEGGIATYSQGDTYGVYGKDIIIEDNAIVTANGGRANVSYGVQNPDSLNISGNAKLTATGGRAHGNYSLSYGVYSGYVTIAGGTVIATGGEMDNEGNSNHSYGVLGYYSITITDGTVAATGGNTNGNLNGSYGIRCEADDSKITISGGAVTATSGTAPTSRAMNKAPVLSGYTSYQWRTTTEGTFTSSPTAYVWEEEHTYIEIKPTPPTTYTVTVSSGTGSGNYTAGATVNITADPAPIGKVFDKWVTTDGITFADENATTTSFTMPEKAVTVTATYKDAPPTTYTGGSGSSYNYYSIPATAGDGGTISPSGRVREGRDQTFIITPKEGYVIADVLVDGVSVGAVSEYTFEDVQEHHTIEAVFIEAPPAEPEETTPDTGVWTNPFTDVSEDAWYYNDVRYVHEQALMAGTAADQFSPRIATDRGMMVTILWRLEGAPEATESMTFTDVAEGKYYQAAVKWAAENGIVGGYSATSFGPEDDITREQLAAILCGYAEYKERDVSARDDLSKFKDKPSDWALESVQWAVAEGLLTGKGDGLLDPRAGAGRAECAAILKRFIEKYGLL